MPHVLAVDAGTTSVRTLAVDESGTVTAVAQRPLTQHYPRPGWVEHDPDEIWAATRATLHEVAGVLAERRQEVVALGITNQRETVVAWDRSSGQVLHRAIVWQDRRTAPLCTRLAGQGHLPLVRSRTGLVLDSYFSGTKMAWLLDEAGLRERASSPRTDVVMGTVDTWLVWQLTGGTDGGLVVTDVTNAGRTMLYDVVRGEWSDELLELLGVPAGVLAEVRPSCGRLGSIHPATVGEGNSLDGVPISGVAGDQHAALFGQACFRPGMAKVTYGTGSFALLTCGPEWVEPPEGLVVTPAWHLGDHAAGPALTYALEGSVFNSGSAVQWLRDGLGLIEAADETEPLARSVDDAGGVHVVPAFTGLGSPWWDPRARGAVVGITRGTTRAHLARAVVEAMAFQVQDMLEAMAAHGPVPVTSLRADGGAAVMDLLLELQADQLRVPVSRPRSVETTALGAATLAGLAEGLWGDLAALETLWGEEARMTPAVPEEITRARYEGWLRALGAAREWAPA